MRWCVVDGVLLAGNAPLRPVLAAFLVNSKGERFVDETLSSRTVIGAIQRNCRPIGDGLPVGACVDNREYRVSLPKMICSSVFSSSQRRLLVLFNRELLRSISVRANISHKTTLSEIVLAGRNLVTRYLSSSAAASALEFPMGWAAAIVKESQETRQRGQDRFGRKDPLLFSAEEPICASFRSFFFCSPVAMDITNRVCSGAGGDAVDWRDAGRSQSYQRRTSGCLEWKSDPRVVRRGERSGGPARC